MTAGIDIDAGCGQLKTNLIKRRSQDVAASGITSDGAAPGAGEGESLRLSGPGCSPSAPAPQVGTCVEN